MTKTLRLNDLQLILLSTASQRDDGSLLPPPDSIGERTPAVDKAIKSLLRRGLAAKPDASDISDLWPADKNQLIDVQITAAAGVALNVRRAEIEGNIFGVSHCNCSLGCLNRSAMLLSARHVAGDVSNRAHFYIPLVNRPRRSNTERLGACYV